MSSNRISRSLFPFLGKLLSLEYLDISSNSYGGPFPFHDIYCLSNLKVLKLSSNHFNGTLIIQNRTALPNLQVLELADNHLDDISIKSGALPSLKALSMSGNELNDSVIPELCELIQFKGLEELNLGGNSLTVIPQCFHNLSSLKLLDLSQNGIIGQVPSSWISKLTSLKHIDIGDNNFQGLFSFSTFNNHSQLELVRLGSNNDSFSVETEDSNWSPEFQLKYLVLSKCNLNMFNLKIPKFLLQQYELRQVDLSHNNLQGTFPSWLLTNNSRMEILLLRNNSFTGELCVPLYPMMDLLAIDISKNQIQGKLPENIGNIFPNLTLFKSSGNAFGGNLPFSVGLMRELLVLDLSSNNFKGEVPKTVLNCTRLKILKLSNNEFCNEFFSTHYNLRALEVLQLNDNKFTGSMSDAAVNSRKLFLFDMSNNFMSGKVPTWIARTELIILNLRNNSLEGELQCEWFAPIYVDLSQNFLSGTIPSCSTMQNLIALHLQSNNFSGSIPKALLNSSRLSLLNLRNNILSGNIHDTIGELPNLRVLLLGDNQLSGYIPKNLCLLKDLTLMDLSSNYFSGSIPSCLCNIKFGKIDDQSTFGNEISIHKTTFFSALGLGYQAQTTLFFGTSSATTRNQTLNPLILKTIPVQLEYEPVGLEKTITMDIIVDILKDIEVVTQIDFITKNRYNTYKGDIRNFVSGLDFSSNYLVGEIPPELGNLSQIHAINMSHNLLTGPIPITFANLTQVESLDLSHNNLSGKIPLQLTQLTFLGVFSVAYNNLSGTIPYGKAQFGTFESSSFEGNSLLCGPPLKKNCSRYDESNPLVVPLLSANDDRSWYDIDLAMFFASFSASFVIFFLGVIAFLYVNSDWRQWLFYYGEHYTLSFYYFVRDTFFLLPRHICNN